MLVVSQPCKKKIGMRRVPSWHSKSASEVYKTHTKPHTRKKKREKNKERKRSKNCGLGSFPDCSTVQSGCIDSMGLAKAFVEDTRKTYRIGCLWVTQRTHQEVDLP
jgi:hypothetical protein